MRQALLFVILFLVTTTRALAVSPCNANDQDLTSTIHGVIFDEPQFTWNGQQYPIQVFSIAAPAPWAPNFICLRYELKNIGTSKIPILYWDLYNEWTPVDLEPNDRLKRVRKRLSATKEPVPSSTVIKAFRSEEVPSTAWRTLEDSQANIKKAAAESSSQYVRFGRASEFDQALATAVSQKKISDDIIAMVDPGGDPTDMPPSLADALTGPFGELSTTSYIYLAGRGPTLTYGVSSQILINRKPGVQIIGYAPGLVALDDTRGSGDSSSYLAALSKAVRPIPRLAEKGDFSTSAIAYTNKIYIVEQPVTVKWTTERGSGTMCVKAAFYSPFPAPLGQDLCAK